MDNLGSTQGQLRDNLETGTKQGELWENLGRTQGQFRRTLVELWENFGDNFGTTQGQLRDNLGSTLGYLWENLGSTQGQVRDNFWITFGQLRVNLGTTLGQLWDNFWTTQMVRTHIKLQTGAGVWTVNLLKSISIKYPKTLSLWSVQPVIKSQILGDWNKSSTCGQQGKMLQAQASLYDPSLVSYQKALVTLLCFTEISNIDC